MSGFSFPFPSLFFFCHGAIPPSTSSLDCSFRSYILGLSIIQYRKKRGKREKTKEKERKGKKSKEKQRKARKKGKKERKKEEKEQACSYLPKDLALALASE